MFSQWRSKRHFPIDSNSSTSAYPTSSQPTAPVDSIFPQRDVRPMPSISGSSRAAAGVKAFGGRVGIGSKGPKFRPGTRDGSGGARSPMSFAAGPRSGSRRGNSLEFGGGVVPDDSHSEADPSDSSASPVTPQHIASTDSKSSTASLGQTDVNTTSTSLRHTNAAQQQQQHSEQKDTHARLELIDTLGSFEDFRSLIAFSSPSNLLDESPALTTSTDLSSPEFAAPVAVTTAKDKPLPLVMSNKPQPPIPTPVETEVAPATSSSNHANAAQSFRAPPKRVAVKLNSTSADEPMHLRPQSNAVQRRSTASSLPESVSQPGSSQLASEEFHSPSRKTSNVTDAMRRLEESIQQGPASTAKFGLGIILPEDARPANNTANRPINNTAAIRNSLSTRRNTKTSSDMSSRSSAESWGRTSFGRDALRMLIDSENAIEAEKPASLASNKTQKTYVSDSGHSTNTAETSTDLHDSDQLSTIKERTESPESVLKRHISMESGLSRSDARTSRTSASSARSEAYRTASPEPRLFRTLEAANSLGRVDARRGSDKELTSLSKAAVNGIGSPTFGFRQRKTSLQSSAANELLPPLDLDAPEYSAHGRRGSSASSTHTRKGPIDLSVIADLRRGSAGVLSSTPGSRLAAEPYTAPLPSLPFPASSSAPLLQASMARSAAQSSEPNTPNLVYEAALAKAVGKQRKSRPAALALNLSALSAFPSNGSLMSPNNLAFMGLASPGKPRAPPPSAPPTEPLPPIPNTPSLAPKSPNPLQRSGSGHTTASRSSVAVSDEVDPLRTPKGSRSPSSGKARDSRGSQMSQSRFSGPAPASSRDLLSLSATRRGSEGVKQVEPVSPAETRDVGAVEPTVAVGAATSEVSSDDSPTMASVDKRADSRSTTIVAAQTVKRASSRPVRYSVSRKEAGPKDESSMSVVKAAPSHTPTDEVASPFTPSQASDKSSKGATPTVKVDQELPSSPAAPGQIVSFDVEPERRDAQPQQQPQAQSQPRRMTATENSSRPPPSVWNARKATSVATHGDSDSASVTNSTTDANASRSEMGRGDLRDGANSVASCHSTFSSISDRRREILSDKEALLGQLNESTRQEILRRTEGRFAGAFNEVATAFRQLQADKLLLEQIVREKTPLSGVGTNNEQLSNYLSTMNAKLDHSNAEIRKLLDLLEQQREVIEQLLATHQLEKETLQEDVERLHEALTQVEAEAERNRDTVIRLNAELTRAHAATVQANAEAMRARTTLVEEGRKREKVVVLLRQAKERLREVETEDLSSSSAPGARGKDDESEKDAELASLRKLLEERDAEIASLRLSHADAVMQESSTADDASSISHQDNPAPAPPPTDDSASPCAASDEVARLREQIAEQKEREKQIRTAYVYVRDELRKANTDRRRSSITVHHATPTSSTLAPSLSARRNADQEALQEVLSAEKGQGETPVKLKRLSLPIVARASGIHGGGVSPDSLAHPPSSFRSPTESGSATGHSRRHSRQILTR